MSFAHYSEVIKAGDTVFIFENAEAIKPIVVAAGKIFSNRFGDFPHADMIGKRFGTKISSKNRMGWVYALHPTPELWTVSLPHRTQILYGADISTIICFLDLRPGSVVCESGTGSGSLSHALAKTVMPTGHVYSYEFHEQRAEQARVEFESHGISQWITTTHGDACVDGFGLDGVADAIFLDLPKPWGAFATARKAIKAQGGRLCTFSPCIEQVQKSCQGLADHGFLSIQTFSCLERPYELRPMELAEANLSTPPNGAFISAVTNTPVAHNDAPQKKKRKLTLEDKKQARAVCEQIAAPADRMPGHTGYLTFATLPPLSQRADVVLAPNPEAAAAGQAQQ